MSDRSEHLIERAAARLRRAGPVHVPDQASGLPPEPIVDSSDTLPPAGSYPQIIPLPPSAPVEHRAGSDTPVPPPLSAGATPAVHVTPPPVISMPPAPEPPQQAAAAGLTFQPLRIPGQPAALPPADAARPSPDIPTAPRPPIAQPLTPGPTPADGVPDTFAGPIPTPARPLTRPVLSGPPPFLSIPAASIGPGISQPLNPGMIAGPAIPSLANRPAFGAPGTDQRLGPQGPGSTMALQPPPIVQLDALERAGMVVARTTRTRISEEYRIAIGRILRVLHETTDIQGARNVLMVTSARPGEGKSFTALNLAGSIAQNGTDAVLLVDVDPKVKPLSDQLGLGDVRGFLDLVSDPSLRPEDLLRVTAIPNLAVMPVGTRLGGAAQTIGGTASMRPIIPTITRLARRFPKHLIMLDAPPCLSTSDPHTLAPHVGQVVLVVEAERTQRSEVEAAVDLVRVCPAITLLLNKVRMTTSHTFGAYDYFGSYT